MSSLYAGPWGQDEHPADWAYRTGRVTAESREYWRAQYDDNPAEAGPWLAMLVPILADPTVANLARRAEQQEQQAEADEFAHLFPPTDHTPNDPGEFAGLFPPAR